jgi:hypothetical protein
VHIPTEGVSPYCFINIICHIFYLVVVDVQAFTSRRSRKTLVRRQTQVKPLTDGDYRRDYRRRSRQQWLLSSAASYNEYCGTASPSTTSGTVGLRQRRTQLSSDYAYYDQDYYTRDGSSATNSQTIRSTRKMVLKLDIFTKVEKDMIVNMERGGMITIISYCIMVP